MRKSRVNLPNRCYHLISRVAHRAFFLDDGERTRLVDLVRRVSRFSGVKLLAYGVMSNHFHVFVYIGHPERANGDCPRSIRRSRIGSSTMCSVAPVRRSTDAATRRARNMTLSGGVR